MDFGQSLFDFIGIFIGFICVILLLSIIVTTMVQTIQAGLRLRGRNLQRGIRAVIETVYGTKGLDPKVLALKALHSKNICFLGRIDETPEKNAKRFLGPAVSYIDPEDLPKALELAGLEDAGNGRRAAEIKEVFNKMWKQLENRFLTIIRFVTVLCAILVAGYFQVSTPALLEKLSKDKTFLDRTAGIAEGIEKPVALPTHGELSEKAIATREGGFSDFEEKIKAARAASGMPARIDITGWQQEWGFYFKSGAVQWGNVIGVLMTAALLTLGAPFWFEQLKRAMNLRDILSKGIKKGENGKNNEDGKSAAGGNQIEEDEKDAGGGSERE